MSRIEIETWYIRTETDTAESFWGSIRDGEIEEEASRLWMTKGPGFKQCYEQNHSGCAHGKQPIAQMAAVRVVEVSR